MKKGIMNMRWIDDGGVLSGVCLGSDFCAEHEVGIHGIRTRFDIIKTDKERTMFGIKIGTKPIFGMEIRTIKINSARMIRVNDRFIITTKEEIYDSYLKSIKNVGDLTTYWDAEDFAIMSTDGEKMDIMWKAFQELDIAIFLNGGGAFNNPGLNICIASKVSKEMRDGMYAADELAYRTNVESEKSGIHKKLEKAGLHYYALTPRLHEGVLRFWLNPADQHKYEAGWYSLTELEQWVNGEGPVIKKREEVEDAG